MRAQGAARSRRCLRRLPSLLPQLVCEHRTREDNVVREQRMQYDRRLVVAPSGQPLYALNGTVRVAAEDLGGSGGDPLLLVMGMAVSRFWWPGTLVGEFIRRGFHVVAY